jgi:hypothetical protein
MLVLITMRCDQVVALDGTVDRDFALFAAANCADLFALGQTESLFFSFFADWAGHGFVFQRDEQNTLCRVKCKRAAYRSSGVIYGPTIESEGAANGFVRTCSGRNPIPITRAGNCRSHGYRSSNRKGNGNGEKLIFPSSVGSTTRWCA